MSILFREDVLFRILLKTSSLSLCLVVWLRSNKLKKIAVEVKLQVKTDAEYFSNFWKRVALQSPLKANASVF